MDAENAVEEEVVVTGCVCVLSSAAVGCKRALNADLFFSPLQKVLKPNEIPGGPESQKIENMSRAFGADFPKYEPRLRRGFSCSLPADGVGASEVL